MSPCHSIDFYIWMHGLHLLLVSIQWLSSTSFVGIQEHDCVWRKEPLDLVTCGSRWSRVPRPTIAFKSASATAYKVCSPFSLETGHSMRQSLVEDTWFGIAVKLEKIRNCSITARPICLILTFVNVNVWPSVLSFSQHPCPSWGKARLHKSRSLLGNTLLKTSVD